jgi:hypothetical protein
MGPSQQVGLKKCYLRWVPHALPANQKNEKMSNSKLPLAALMEHKPTDSGQMITGDKSWFFRHYPRDSA